MDKHEPAASEKSSLVMAGFQKKMSGLIESNNWTIDVFNDWKIIKYAGKLVTVLVIVSGQYVR